MKHTAEERKNFIVNTINLLVRRTRTPVTAKVLQEANVCTRSELRKLERDGIVKSIQVYGGQGIMNAYYTEGEVPDALRPKHVEHIDPAGPSEGEVEAIDQGSVYPEEIREAGADHHAETGESGT